MPLPLPLLTQPLAAYTHTDSDASQCRKSPRQCIAKTSAGMGERLKAPVNVGPGFAPLIGTIPTAIH